MRRVKVRRGLRGNAFGVLGRFAGWFLVTDLVAISGLGLFAR